MLSVIVTLGEKGSLYVSKEEKLYVPIQHEVKVKDTSGAGDCFLGSFAYFYGLKNSFKTSMEKANRIAGISVENAGCQSSFPRRDGGDIPKDVFV